MINAPDNIVRQGWKVSRGGLLAVVVFGAFINLLKFAMPMYTLQILDRVPDNRSVETLLMLTVIALIAVLAGVSLESIRRRMLVQWSGWVNRYFGPHLVQAGISRRHTKQHRAATRSLDNLQAIRSFIEKSAAAMLDLVWVPLFVAVVYHMHPLFGGIMLLAMGLRLMSGFVENQLTRPSRQQWSIASRDARAMVDAAERHNASINAAAMSYPLSRKWLDSIRTKLAEREASQNHASLFAAINTALYRCLYVAGMGFGVWLVIGNAMSIGGVIAVNIIMRFGFRIMDKGVRRWGSLHKARRAYRHLRRQLARTPSTQLPMMLDDAELKAPLVIEQLAHRYPGQANSIIRRVNLSVQPGEMLCVIGRSAAGKSTFARLVSGLLNPRRGRVRLGERDVSSLIANPQQPLIGYLPEEARLFSASIAENIASLHGGDQAAIIDAAQLAGLHERITQLPDGYHTRIDDHSVLLSAGERRRLLLARAYYRRPRLIVLDEPAAHLDRPGREQLIAAIDSLKASGCSIIVTSQSNRLGQIADQTYLLGRRARRRTRNARREETTSGQIDVAPTANLLERSA